MWIVVFALGGRHSAWNSWEEAMEQCAVLQDSGYGYTKVICDETVSCENGHYYV